MFLSVLVILLTTAAGDTLNAVLKEEQSILDSMEQALAEEESSFLGEEMFVTSFAGG